MPQTRAKWKSHLINYTFNWSGESGAFMVFCYVQYGFLEPKLFSRLVSPPFWIKGSVSHRETWLENRFARKQLVVGADN